MLEKNFKKENILQRAFPQTLGLFILLLITIWGARFATEIAKDVSEMRVHFVDVVDPMKSYDSDK